MQLAARFMQLTSLNNHHASILFYCYEMCDILNELQKCPIFEVARVYRAIVQRTNSFLTQNITKGDHYDRYRFYCIGNG